MIKNIQSLWNKFWSEDISIPFAFLRAFLIFLYLPIGLALSPILVPISVTIAIIQKNRGPASKAEILEEMCASGLYRKTLRASYNQLTHVEQQIMFVKTSPIQPFPWVTQFPVKDKVSPKLINRWLADPKLNAPMDADTILSTFGNLIIPTNTPIPSKIMENMLKRLLGNEYKMYWKSAKHKLKIQYEEKKKTEEEKLEESF